jgi:GAF domain-containing protein
MMTNRNKTASQVTDYELAGMRHSLNLLRTQLQAGRLDQATLSRQVDKLIDLMARLEGEHKQLKKQQRLEALYNVSRLLGSSLDPQVVLDQVMDSILKLTGADRGFLMLRNDDGVEEVKAARGLDQQTLSSDQFKYSRTVVNKVMDTGEPILTTNATEDPRFSSQASIVNQAIRNIMAIPLRVRGKVIGAIYVDSRATSGLLDEEDLEAMDMFAGQAAITLDNAQLFAATDQQLAARVEELRQLRRIDMQVNETLDADKVRAYTLEWACRLAGADLGHFGMIENDRVVAYNHYGVHTDDTQPLFLDATYPQTREVARKGESMLLTDSQKKQSVMLVPVQREQKVQAVLVLRRSGVFTPDQVELVERVAARAALAI